MYEQLDMYTFSSRYFAQLGGGASMMFVELTKEFL